VSKRKIVEPITSQAYADWSVTLTMMTVRIRNRIVVANAASDTPFSYNKALQI
jgi:hypothetical protein